MYFLFALTIFRTDFFSPFNWLEHKMMNKRYFRHFLQPDFFLLLSFRFCDRTKYNEHKQRNPTH